MLPVVSSGIGAGGGRMLPQLLFVQAPGFMPGHVLAYSSGLVAEVPMIGHRTMDFAESVYKTSATDHH